MGRAVEEGGLRVDLSPFPGEPHRLQIKPRAQCQRDIVHDGSFVLREKGEPTDPAVAEHPSPDKVDVAVHPAGQGLGSAGEDCRKSLHADAVRERFGPFRIAALLEPPVIVVPHRFDGEEEMVGHRGVVEPAQEVAGGFDVVILVALRGDERGIDVSPVQELPHVLVCQPECERDGAGGGKVLPGLHEKIESPAVVVLAVAVVDLSRKEK